MPADIVYVVTRKSTCFVSIFVHLCKNQELGSQWHIWFRNACRYSICRGQKMKMKLRGTDNWSEGLGMKERIESKYREKMKKRKKYIFIRSSQVSGCHCLWLSSIVSIINEYKSTWSKQLFSYSMLYWSSPEIPKIYLLVYRQSISQYWEKPFFFISC